MSKSLACLEQEAPERGKVVLRGGARWREEARKAGGGTGTGDKFALLKITPSFFPPSTCFLPLLGLTIHAYFP